MPIELEPAESGKATVFRYVSPKSVAVAPRLDLLIVGKGSLPAPESLEFQSMIEGMQSVFPAERPGALAAYLLHLGSRKEAFRPDKSADLRQDMIRAQTLSGYWGDWWPDTMDTIRRLNGERGNLGTLHIWYLCDRPSTKPWQFEAEEFETFRSRERGLMAAKSYFTLVYSTGGDEGAFASPWRAQPEHGYPGTEHGQIPISRFGEVFAKSPTEN